MRRIVCLAVMMSAGVASMAHADGAAPSTDGSGGGASAAAAAAVLAVPLMPELERVDLVTRRPFGDDPFNRFKGAMRHRFASQMIDLYPVQSSGFHASFGTRFFKKAYIRRDQEAATNGLLYNVRLPRGAQGMRGFRRATPAATFGYTELLRPNLMVGLEGGTLLGRVVQTLPSGRRLAGLPGAARAERGMRMNPVLNLTVAYAF